MCSNCTSDDMDATYRKIGYSKAEVKALRASRENDYNPVPPKETYNIRVRIGSVKRGKPLKQ